MHEVCVTRHRKSKNILREKDWVKFTTVNKEIHVFSCLHWFGINRIVSRLTWARQKRLAVFDVY